MTQLQTVSFLVVTYNSRQTIEECLSSIFGQKTNPLEVLVVDNASIDGTPDFVESLFPRAILIRNRRNVGFGAANNTAARTARGEIVAMVNPDASLDPRWSIEIANSIQSNRACAAAEGLLLLANRPGFINCAGSSINLVGFGCMTHYGEPAATAGEEEKLVGYPSGAAFAIRREIFLSLGGFDESYFLYHDDVDLGLRIYEAGWQIRYVPSAIAYHHYKSALSPSKLRHLERNRWKTLAKHMPAGYFALCGPLLCISECGIFCYLIANGLLQPKMRAIVDFLSELPPTWKLRKEIQENRRKALPLNHMLTADVPTAVIPSGGLALLAGAIMTGYRNAFLRPWAPWS